MATRREGRLLVINNKHNLLLTSKSTEKHRCGPLIKPCVKSVKMSLMSQD